MNRLLATVLDFWNLFLAFVIIIVTSSLVERYIVSAKFPSFVGYVLGAGLGVVVAATICGVIALLILIEQHLRVLTSGLDRD
ncbi:hypothetical protein M0654_22540 [Rhizobium sp. NTR19]|uniref:Uncharacterized protein n=1 Tax=Neorhizobium turbinariae TaxID=2937795 RepID=A0ABT0IXX3_9HYPH|nr:hypothetical protein [Neorhizobium turbinariae]MCK8782734.1 hypothetical protein [Neorhizobium turbinariae]